MEELELDRHAEIDSSLIKSIGVKDHYLVVEFNSSEIYRYPHQSHQFDTLRRENSAGGYFWKHVRDQKFDKLRDNQWPDGDDE